LFIFADSTKTIALSKNIAAQSRMLLVFRFMPAVQSENSLVNSRFWLEKSIFFDDFERINENWKGDDGGIQENDPGWLPGSQFWRRPGQCDFTL
jgi:hypothetical protein